MRLAWFLGCYLAASRGSVAAGADVVRALRRHGAARPRARGAARGAGAPVHWDGSEGGRGRVSGSSHAAPTGTQSFAHTFSGAQNVLLDPFCPASSSFC